MERAVQTAERTATRMRCQAWNLRSFRYVCGAIGPTIFWIGVICSSFPVLDPMRIPGRPSMLYAFLNAQYLKQGNLDHARRDDSGVTQRTCLFARLTCPPRTAFLSLQTPRSRSSGSF